MRRILKKKFSFYRIFFVQENLGAPGVNFSQTVAIIPVPHSLLFQYQEAIVM